jgi:hypothetical protein
MTTPGEFWTRWRVRLGYPVAIACFLLARPTPTCLAIGAGIAALGLVLRGAAAGRLRKHEQLATAGPYAYTRNPLYLGSALLAAGFLVASRSWIAAGLLSTYFVLFYWVVMRREEQELRARYGTAFDDYAARVPLFWPRVTPRELPGASGHNGFSWSLYFRNREYRAALGWLVGVAALWLWMYRRR